MLLVCIRNYLKSVVRYKLPVFGYLSSDPLYLCERRCDDPWLFSETKRGLQKMTFGKHSFKYSHVIFIMKARCVPCEVRSEYACLWCRIILVFILLDRNNFTSMFGFLCIRNLLYNSNSKQPVWRCVMVKDSSQLFRPGEQALYFLTLQQWLQHVVRISELVSSILRVEIGKVDYKLIHRRVA